MANSNDTKQAIRLEIERLTNQRRSLRKQIIPIRAKADSIKNRINSLTASIVKLEADLV